MNIEELEVRMEIVEAETETIKNMLLKMSADKSPAPSELDKKVDEVVKNILIEEDAVYICGEEYILATYVTADVLNLSIFPSSNNHYINTEEATRDHFDIIEGTLEQAELGDLALIEDDKHAHVIGFTDGKKVACNYLKGSLISGYCLCSSNKAIILRIRK